MSEVEAKKPRNGVPPGFKICPTCKNLVKGPRTKVCGCGHQFQPKNAAKAKPGKAKKTVKEVVQPKIEETPQVPDPWTFHETVSVNFRKNVSPKGEKPWNGMQKATTTNVALKPKKAGRALEYVRGLETIGNIVMENAVDTVLI